jgi:predicted DNA-binding transcriptional regulator AlpA
MQTDQAAPADLQLLSVSDVLALLGVTRTTLFVMRRNGQFPRPVHVGAQLRWRVSDVRAWMDKGGAQAGAS